MTASTRRSYAARRQLFGVVLVLPAILFFAVFFVIPLGMTVWMSLHDWPLLGTPKLIGLRNFERLPENALFIDSLVFTLEFALAVVPLVFVLGLLLALLFQSSGRLIALARTAVFLPVPLGFAAASYLWLSLLNTRVGVVDKMLVDTGLSQKPIDWFVEPVVALAVAVFVTAWKTSGFSMVVLINGLHAIPPEVKEAAKIDGAGPVRAFFYVDLPLLRDAIALVLTFLAVGAFLTFEQFYVLTAGSQNRTVTLVYRIYNTSFVQDDLGRGSAMSIVFLLIVLAITGTQLYLLRRK